MKDEDVCEFFKTEVDYFVDKMSNKSLQRTAIAAAGTPKLEFQTLVSWKLCHPDVWPIGRV